MKTSRSQRPLPVKLCMWLLLVLGALAAVACDSTETRTQLTFNISASSGLQGRMSALRVFVRSNNTGDVTRDFPIAGLKWPVEIVVIPTPSRGNDSTDEVTLVASALDDKSQLIVEKSSTVRFQPERDRKIALALDMDVDAGSGDSGRPNGGQDEGGTVEPPPEEDAGDQADTGTSEPDAGPAQPNCATAGSTIKCDDGNPCNGTETCEPASSDADSQGCVKGADTVTCMTGMTCDRSSGKCSECLTNADGDKDGVKSVSCGGTDCNDSDETIAPGKPELCDGKDNDCDLAVDGVNANAACASAAPTGGAAMCTAMQCVASCTDPTYVIRNKICVPNTGTCPIVNPCGPTGTCMGVVGGYACMCGAGYSSGVAKTSCIQRGSWVSVGFERTCDGTTDTFAAAPGAASQPISPTLFAPCGLATIGTNVVGAQPVLVRPTAGVLQGLTGATALASVPPSTGASQLTFSFGSPVNTIAFDVLGVAEPMALAVVATVSGVDGMAVAPTATAGTTKLHFNGTYATGATRFTVTYTPTLMASSNQFYIDELTFTVAGCGDKSPAPGEGCDDGNSIQCDGCDNACVVNAPGTTCTP